MTLDIARFKRKHSQLLANLLRNALRLARIETKGRMAMVVAGEDVKSQGASRRGILVAFLNPPRPNGCIGEVFGPNRNANDDGGAPARESRRADLRVCQVIEAS